MSNVWFCSDLHLGHKNIGKFRSPLVESEEQNNTRIIGDIKTTVDKRDDLYVLGDWCFDMEMVDIWSSIACRKKYLIRGNHDNFDLGVYTKYFDDVFGLVKYKEFWLSHAPIHPDELRGRVNLHGHVHFSSIEKPFNPVYDVRRSLDTRYFNCCPENLWPMKNRALISLDEVRKIYANCNR